MDQYTGYKELELFSTKNDFMELTSKKFSKWKNNGNPIIYIRHDNAPKNNVLIKIANDLQWKLGILVQYAGKDMPKRNELVELEFTDVACKARAMMVQATC